MTERDTQESGLDVEAIIEQIRTDVAASELPVNVALTEAARLDSDLASILEDANAFYRVGDSSPGGVKGFVYRMLLRMLAPLVGELNRFNSLSVRSLNKLSKMLTGNDTASDSDLIPDHSVSSISGSLMVKR